MTEWNTKQIFTLILHKRRMALNEMANKLQIWTPFCITLSLVMKHGSTIMSQRANVRKKLKPQLTSGKVMLRLFWDS
jgi:hypothetical protein